MAKLSNEERLLILAKLSEKESYPACTSCGNPNFLTAEDMLSIKIDGSSDEGYKVVALVCDKCGYFNLYHFNLLTDQMKAS